MFLLEQATLLPEDGHSCSPVGAAHLAKMQRRCISPERNQKPAGSQGFVWLLSSDPGLSCLNATHSQLPARGKTIHDFTRHLKWQACEALVYYASFRPTPHQQ